MGDHKTCVADPGRLISAPGLVTFIIKKKKLRYYLKLINYLLRIRIRISKSDLDPDQNKSRPDPQHWRKEWAENPQNLKIVDWFARCGDDYHRLLTHPDRELVNDRLHKDRELLNMWISVLYNWAFAVLTLSRSRRTELLQYVSASHLSTKIYGTGTFTLAH